MHIVGQNSNPASYNRKALLLVEEQGFLNRFTFSLTEVIPLKFYPPPH